MYNAVWYISKYYEQEHRTESKIMDETFFLGIIIIFTYCHHKRKKERKKKPERRKTKNPKRMPRGEYYCREGRAGSHAVHDSRGLARRYNNINDEWGEIKLQEKKMSTFQWRK